jgi:hypothetical protein
VKIYKSVNIAINEIEQRCNDEASLGWSVHKILSSRYLTVPANSLTLADVTIVFERNTT